MSIANSETAEAPRTKRRKLSHDPESDSDASVPLETSESSSEDETKSSSRQHGNDEVRGSSRTSQVPNGVQNTKPLGSGKSVVTMIQFDQLLAEAKLDRSQQPTDELPLERIRQAIQSIPETEAMLLGQAEASLHGKVAIPFPTPRPSKDSNLKFCFRSPASAEETASRTEGIIRLEVEMAKDTLQEKDYLNLRAFYKRAFYLAYIAAHITPMLSKDFDLNYAYDDELELLPVLEISTKAMARSEQKTKCVVNVGFPEGVFPSDKCSPLKNCVRFKGEITDDELQPTPVYNSCLSSCVSRKATEKLITKKLSSNLALQDACYAGKIWLDQRGFSGDISRGGFGVKEWTMMCAILLETGGHRNTPLFSDRYNHLQIFKAMLQVLAGKDMADPWILHSSLSIPPSEYPVFYDGQLGFNVLFKMSPWSYQTLRREAQLSLAALNSKTENSFDLVFNSPVAETILQYDEVFSLSIPNVVNNDAFQPQQVARKLYTILKRGLGDRASLVVLNCSPAIPWPIQKTPAKLGSDIQVCLLTNPETVSRLVDHGPSADEPEESAQFRQFWGEKAELRRFKDGSISESLVWSANEPVTLQIVRHLVVRHLKHRHSTVVYRTQKLENTILPQNVDFAPSEAFQIINKRYQSLTSTLHQLEGLPLPIRSISPVDPALRSSTIFSPLDPSSSTPINILIQFDSSTRWPDSLPAIQHTKIAFLVKLSDLLTTSDSTITARTGLENTSSSTSGHLNTSFLDIIYPATDPTLAPICFRLRIHHDREQHLLQTALADKSLHGSVRDRLTSALAIHKRDCIASPTHTTAIRNLVTKFPPLSTTIRLLKKWISSHLLSRLIPAEIVEILAAHVFLNPYPWSVPGSATVAFFRCLWVLSRWDWTAEPLIVDLSLSQDQLGVKERDEMRTRFEAWRKKLDPNMNGVAWFVGTSVDETGVVWTGGGRVEKVVAGRVKALAEACMEVVIGKGVDMEEGDVKGLFKTPMEGFDFLLQLNREVVKGGVGNRKKSGRSGEGGFKNLQIAASLSEDEIGFDPVELYLQDLEKAFGNTALFFYDSNGGRVIAGLWRPSVLASREWRVRMGYSTKPVVENGEEPKVMGEFNREAVLGEMRLMGEGIVKSVSVRDK